MKTKPFFEKRSEHREFHKVPVSLQELNDVFIYNARITNYSDNGAYIESDISMGVGTDVLIGIEGSTSISPLASSDSPKYFYAKIVWQKNLRSKFFKFGYGIKFVNAKDIQNAATTSSTLQPENRKHHRKPYYKEVTFKSNNHDHFGFICNISQGGAFIETMAEIKTGQVIEITIPGTKIDNGRMLVGEVVHLSQSGAGVCFKGIINENPL